MKHPRSAFTLIELLVVIGIIAVLASVFGLAFGRGSSGAALQSSQATLLGLFSAARGQAAIGQNTANIVVNVSPSSEGFLREFYVIVNGRAVGSPVTLSQGIYLLPPTTGETFSAAISFTAPSAWLDRTSTGFNNVAVPPATTGLESGVNYRTVAGITSLGRSSPAGGGNIILAPADRLSGQTISFNNPDAIRGVKISTYGVLTFLNSYESL